MKTIEVNDVKKKELLNYGFTLKDNVYYYEKNIINNKFKVIIEINNIMNSKVVDNISNEEYILVDIESASGNFVGKAREEYNNIINDIISKCTTRNKYKNKQTNTIINYIKKTYKDAPEFLWKKFDTTCAIRNKKNKKWYAAIMIVNDSKLGLNNNQDIEIIDIRYQKDKVDEIIDNKTIFPGYHMNKKSWITIILDNSLDNEIIYSLIDNSYELSLNNK